MTTEPASERGTAGLAVILPPRSNVFSELGPSLVPRSALNFGTLGSGASSRTLTAAANVRIFNILIKVNRIITIQIPIQTSLLKAERIELGQDRLSCKTRDLTIRTRSDAPIHSMASMMREAEKDLSMTRASLAPAAPVLRIIERSFPLARIAAMT